MIIFKIIFTFDFIYEKVTMVNNYHEPSVLICLSQQKNKEVLYL